MSTSSYAGPPAEKTTFEEPMFGGGGTQVSPPPSGSGVVSKQEPGLDYAWYGINLGQAFIRFFKKYARFDGRASRGEYWWWYLVNAIFYVAFFIAYYVITSPLNSFITTLDVSKLPSEADMQTLLTKLYVLLGISLVWGLATLVPMISLSVRRLHDIGRPGTWFFIQFIPLVGPIWFIILMATPTTRWPTQWDNGWAGADALFTAGLPQGKRKHRGKPGTSGWRAGLEIGVLSGPAIIIFLAFVIFPVFVALYYSFFNWAGYGPATDYIGFGNYLWTLKNKAFWYAVLHNGIIVVMSLVMQGPLAVLVALMLNQKMRGRSLIRVLVFVPYVISEAIVGIGLRLMLRDAGAVNVLLGTHIGWLSNPKIGIWTLMCILTWKYLGFAIILMLAGLQGIPEELSEAAAVDGASYWQIQWHIMLPLLKPTLKVWAFLSIIGSMQLFDLVYVIWGQYIASIAGTSTMAWFMATQGQLAGTLGRGSAIAIIVFIISLIIAIGYQRLVLNHNTEGALTEKEED